MTLKENLGHLYFILPFLFSANNKFGIIFSILTGRSIHKVKIQNQIIQIPKFRFCTLRNLLGCITYAQSYSVDSDKILKISFDENNFFEIPLNPLSFEDSNLIELLYLGYKFGANFISKEIPNIDMRDLTFKISSQNNRKIITTSNGINFFVDSIHPGNSIYEPFIRKIHLLNSKINWENKTVVDVGAECGDTPLFFASMGAKVFAFEAIKKHYDFMLENLKLNPKLSEKIIPINAAIGEDGPLKFFVNEQNDKFGSFAASFVYNNQKGLHYENVTGFQLSTAREKFQIGHIDLLKMDCKGCEFYLSDEDLKDIDRIKIEYQTDQREEVSFSKNSKKSEDLLKLLKKNDFHCMIYRHNIISRLSNSIDAVVFGSRIKF